ncbi:hypothetical protein ACT3TB_11020 [Micrococcaceae sp. AOP34-BR2-30]
MEAEVPTDVSGWEPRLQPGSTQAPPAENFGRGVQDANAQAWAAAQQSRMAAPQHQAGGPGIG